MNLGWGLAEASGGTMYISMDPHHPTVGDYLMKEFPTAIYEEETVVEAVLSALIASSKVRFGPSPTSENLISIRQVIEKVVPKGQPIPILMPWGSKKPDNGSLDVAELGGIKTIVALQKRVQAFYPAGIHLVVRVEDTSGDYLFKEEGDIALWSSQRYVAQFLKFIHVLDLPFIEIKRESKMMDAGTYNVVADELRPYFFKFIRETDTYGIVDDPSLASWRDLAALGWKGFIPFEMRDFYRSRYARSFAGLSLEGQTQKLAGYLASILARIKLQGYGSEQWGRDFINLSFAPPVPGTPAPFAERRLYYRTLPESLARTHIPPWRARGFLRMEGDKIGMKLATFDEPLRLEEHIATLSRGSDSVAMRAPLLHVGG